MVRRTGISTHVECSPNVRGGRPCVAGTGVRVQDVIACYEFQGMTPDQIAAGYPHLTLADVHAALAYYYDHTDEIRRDLTEDEAFIAAFQRDHTRGSQYRNDPDVDSAAS